MLTKSANTYFAGLWLAVKIKVQFQSQLETRAVMTSQCIQPTTKEITGKLTNANKEYYDGAMSQSKMRSLGKLKKWLKKMPIVIFFSTKKEIKLSNCGWHSVTYLEVDCTKETFLRAKYLNGTRDKKYSFTRVILTTALLHFSRLRVTRGSKGFGCLIILWKLD